MVVATFVIGQNGHEHDHGSSPRSLAGTPAAPAWLSPPPWGRPAHPADDPASGRTARAADPGPLRGVTWKRVTGRMAAGRTSRCTRAAGMRAHSVEGPSEEGAVRVTSQRRFLSAACRKYSHTHFFSLSLDGRGRGEGAMRVAAPTVPLTQPLSRRGERESNGCVRRIRHRH